MACTFTTIAKNYITYPQTQFVIYTATEQDNNIDSYRKEIVNNKFFH